VKRPLTAPKEKRGTPGWEQMFKVIRYFQHAHGHCDVPPSTRRGSLAHWLQEQRAEARAGRLHPKRLRRLQALGVEFGERGNRSTKSELQQEKRWEKYFGLLADFKQRHGHCQVSRRDTKFHDLAIWLSNQRQVANARRLRPDRLRRLKKLGMECGKTEHLWNKRFAELQAYKELYGHCDVPARCPENKPLAHWVDNQRCARRRGILKRNRIKRLNQLGFSWSGRFDATAPGSFRERVKTLDQVWDSMFAALLKYKRKHGGCNVQPDDGMDGRLHKWVAARRAEARKGRLREDRRRRLDGIGFLWKGHNPKWDKKFVELVAYKKRFGHCNVPCHGGQNPALGHWVSNQRSFRNKGLLSRERIDRLNGIGFRWLGRFNLNSPPQIFQEQVKALDQLWESGFSKLLLFKKEHGHCRVPSNDSRDYGLFRWVGRQRERWKAGELPEMRRKRLEDLGFEWKPRNPSWELKFAQLVHYKRRFGNCQVPARWTENKPLGLWAHNQRAFWRRGMLSAERIRRLNSIGFVWANRHQPLGQK